MQHIRTAAELATFRSEWTGAAMLKLVIQFSRLLITWVVGVGKSYNIDQTIEAAIRSGIYKCVLVLLPTRLVLQERAWIKHPPDDVKVVNLRPRPEEQCGADANARWQSYEKRSLGQLGRVEICEECPHCSSCFWPEQLGRALKGVQVIFGTHAYVNQIPNFIEQIKEWTEAESLLVLIDEIDLINRPFRRRIRRDQLEMFLDVLPTSQTDKCKGEAWIFLVQQLLHSTTDSLRSTTFPILSFKGDWALSVQSNGSYRHGDEYKFLCYDLNNLASSEPASREVLPSGDITYSVIPAVNTDVIFYSGTAHPELLRLRLGIEILSPFESFRFEHEDTRWYNLCSNIGTAMSWPRNSPQIIDFFAELIHRRRVEGKRILLIIKMKFKPEAVRLLSERLRQLGDTASSFLLENWTAEKIADPNVIPVIHYGVIGMNLFEEFDCAYCLSGYYINAPIINTTLQDLMARDFSKPLKVWTTTTHPRRRRASVRDQSDRFFDVNEMSQAVLDQNEMGQVIQAVGRVRPFTKPREVITFQCAENPLTEYTHEWNSLAQARGFFGISGRRQADMGARIMAIKQACAEGLTQVQTVEKLGLGLRTIKRHWGVPA